MLVFLFSLVLSADLSAADLVAKSIAYHDSEGLWPVFNGTLVTRETRPSRDTDRDVKIYFDLAKGNYTYDGRYDGKVFRRELLDGQTTASLDGETDLSDEDKEKYRLTPERVHWFFRYYRYLYGMPMNLRDPGTNIDPQVTETTFMDDTVLAIRVTYDENVGKDIWYFYFDPSNYALVGMRFFHDENKNDGEYIILDEEIEVGGLLLPKARRWYTNKDGRHLGDDIIEGYREEKP